MARVPIACLAAALSAGSLFAPDAFAAPTPIPLNYNFNGMVHFGEQGDPDRLTGYRSIADRGLTVDGAAGSFGTAAIVGSTGLPYTIVTLPDVVDIVFLGNRSVNWAYDATVDGDNIGVQPSWDPSPNHAATYQVTDVSALNLQMFANTRIGVLHQISNSGGSFDVRITFTDSSFVTCRCSGPDWHMTQTVPAPAAGSGVATQVRHGGLWPATETNDRANTATTAHLLNVTESVITSSKMISDGLGDHTGKTIQSISFGNATYPANFGRGYAIIAVTVDGSAVFPPSGVGSVSPTAPIFNQSAHLMVTVTVGQPTPNAITGVTVNGSSINLPSNIALTDEGGGVWGTNVIIPGDAPAGAASLPFDIVDAQGRHGTGSINFTVVAPPAFTDLGTLPASGVVTASIPAGAGQITWYRFTLASPIDAAAMKFLDIDTEGSILTGTQFANDTEIGLYTAEGNRIADDDDDASGYTSMLTFGVASPARPALAADGLTYNGRDGTVLNAGTYYLCVTGYNATFANTLWGVTTTSAQTGTYQINLRVGSVPPGVQPTEYVNLGSLAAGAQTVPLTFDAPGQVKWVRFVLDSAINTDLRTFLDIDTENSAIGNTVIGLFRGDGTLAATDDNDGSGLLSQLTYGRGGRPAVGDGLAYNGRDGTTLAAGEYYVAVGESPVIFASGWVVFLNNGTSTGSVSVNINRDTAPPPVATIIAGPFHNPANGSDYYLFNTGLSFLDNEAAAQAQLNGHLASIADAAENEFVRGVLTFDGTNRRGFIGATDRDFEGLFVWTDATPFSFTNWGVGEPNNANNNEHYVEMLGSNGMWNDITNAGASGGDFAVVEVSSTPVNQRCQPADIAADNGTALPTDLTINPNGGVNEGDYNSFFQGFFDAAPNCDIANDDATPRAPFGTNGVNGGVNEGDYNCFFQNFFSGCPV